MSRVPPRLGTPLTAREVEVLRLAARGLSNGEIAYRLWLSQHTVKSHMRRIFQKLGASGRTDAVSLGHGLGLFAGEPATVPLRQGASA